MSERPVPAGGLAALSPHLLGSGAAGRGTSCPGFEPHDGVPACESLGGAQRGAAERDGAVRPRAEVRDGEHVAGGDRAHLVEQPQVAAVAVARVVEGMGVVEVVEVVEVVVVSSWGRRRCRSRRWRGRRAHRAEAQLSVVAVETGVRLQAAVRELGARPVERRRAAGGAIRQEAEGVEGEDDGGAWRHSRGHTA